MSGFDTINIFDLQRNSHSSFSHLSRCNRNHSFSRLRSICNLRLVIARSLTENLYLVWMNDQKLSLLVQFKHIDEAMQLLYVNLLKQKYSVFCALWLTTYRRRFATSQKQLPGIPCGSKVLCSNIHVVLLWMRCLNHTIRTITGLFFNNIPLAWTKPKRIFRAQFEWSAMVKSRAIQKHILLNAWCCGQIFDRLYCMLLVVGTCVAHVVHRSIGGKNVFYGIR